MVAVVPESVVDAVAEEVLVAPVPVAGEVARKGVHMVSEIVRASVIEVCRNAVLDEASVARCYSRTSCPVLYRSHARAACTRMVWCSGYSAGSPARTASYCSCRASCRLTVYSASVVHAASWALTALPALTLRDCC